MSSEDESAIPAFKKRKLQRACDGCRRKKVKCDGPRMPDNRCSRCTARRTECTYAQGHNRNYPRSYVEALESRLERMEKLVNKLCPDTGVANEPGAHESDNDLSLVLSTTSQSSHASATCASGLVPPSTSTLALTPSIPGSPENGPHSDEDEGDIDREVSEGMRRLSITSHPFRYHGRSSGMVFVRSALALKDELTGSRPARQGDTQHPWVAALVENDFPVFAESSFPPSDLLSALVDLYFSCMNSQFPLLHEPTFKRAIEAGRHLRNGGIGATVLLVCAIGSRFTRDPRVLLPDSDHPHSAGWKWFRDVEKAKRMSFAPAKLHDLQVYALMALFLDGTTAPQAIWTAVGVGIRAALEVGVHRKKMYASTPIVEEELWRRAFWVLVMLEWMAGYGFGRPSSVHDEDFDLALPTECDDEYWLTPDGEPLFEQPPDKPSKVSGFVYALRLGQILACINRTIYATNKSRAQLGLGDRQWEQRIVADLDSALNRWADSLPSHLRWDPEQEDELFLTQAATLAAWYRALQIAIHRSFMSASRREPPISLPSAIICTNAARESIQVAEVLYKRTGRLTHRNTGIIFTAAVVLMTSVIGVKRSGRTVNVEKDLALVGRTVEMFRSLPYETHYTESIAVTLCDLMSGIADPLPSGVTTSTDPPLSPVAIPLESGALEPRTDSNGPGTRRHRAADTGDAAAGPSFPPPIFAHSGTELHLPPGFNSSFPGTSGSTTSAPPSHGLRPPAQSSLPDNGPTEQPARSPALPHVSAHDFFPLSQNGPPQPQSYSGAPGKANRGVPQNQGGAGGGQLYGLEPLDHNPPMPPPFPLGANDRGFGDAAMEWVAGGAHTDAGIPDFALMDDTLAMWSSMAGPATFGWNDGAASFTNPTNPAGT